MKDCYILHIETATPTCSVALSKNGIVLGAVEADEPNVHASHLTSFIGKVTANAGVTLNALSAVAVSMGPGSYTGLRIGVSAAKGLCYGLEIPLIAINTLEAMVYGYIGSRNIPKENPILVPMIDARRMEVYMATYDHHGSPLGETAAKIIDEHSFSDGKYYALFGSGADKFKVLFEDSPRVTVDPLFRNSASFMAAPAFRRFTEQRFEDIAYFEPYYLKDFVATTPKKRS